MANPNFSDLSGMSVYNPKDIYAIANALVKEVTGQTQTPTAVDTASFIQVGQMCLNVGLEPTLRALSTMISRTFVAIRPYAGKFSSIQKDSQEWGLIVRKISYFATEFDPSTDWNTDRAPNQLVDGASIDMYKIKKTYPLQVFFNGFATLQKDYTRFEQQLKIAFESESAFSSYLYGMSVEIANDIESWKEAENRAVVMNMAGALYKVGNANQRVNLTTKFNDARGTNYTTKELLTTQLQSFLSFFVSYLQTTTDLLEERSELYHLTPACTDDNGNTLHLLRHTPKANQRLLLYQPLINDAKSWVFPAIFGPGYLSFGNYEGINFWQNINDKSSISVKPSYFNVTTGKEVKSKDTVTIPYVVGMLFDNDAMATTYMQEGVYTTPFNTHGRYWNVTHHWTMRYQMDMTENALLFFMDDSDLPVKP